MLFCKFKASSRLLQIRATKQRRRKRSKFSCYKVLNRVLGYHIFALMISKHGKIMIMVDLMIMIVVAMEVVVVMMKGLIA